MKALVTGISGFAGGHLAERLLGEGYEVVGLVRDLTRTPGFDAASGRLRYRQADLLDLAATSEVIAAERPDLIFHLAAQSGVALSWQDPEATLQTNIIGQLHLILAIIEADIKPRVLVVSSDEVYGLMHPDELPATEDSPLRPTNPYGVSKVAQDLMGYQYFISHSLPIVRVRPFSHIGLRQRESFLVPSLARQVAAAEVGLATPVIRIGNLDVRRDFSDVRDIVRGYVLALTDGEPGAVYNLASGRATSVRELLQLFLSHARRPLQVQQDPALMRSTDVPERRGSYAKLHTRTGWQPEISLEQTVADVLEYCRQRLDSSAAPSP